MLPLVRRRRGRRSEREALDEGRLLGLGEIPLETTTAAASNLLQEVWERLEQVFPPDEERSLTELGFVTAVSLVDSELRVLLRLPAALCGSPGESPLLDDLEGAIRAFRTRGEVEVTVKPLVLGPAAIDPCSCAVRIGDQHPATAPGSPPRSSAGRCGVPSGRGEAVIGAEPTAQDPSTQTVRPPSVSVFIRARLERGPDGQEREPVPPLGGA